MERYAQFDLLIQNPPTSFQVDFACEPELKLLSSWRYSDRENPFINLDGNVDVLATHLLFTQNQIACTPDHLTSQCGIVPGKQEIYLVREQVGPHCCVLKESILKASSIKRWDRTQGSDFRRKLELKCMLPLCTCQRSWINLNLCRFLVPVLLSFHVSPARYNKAT